jgi:hypothetical protein
VASSQREKQLRSNTRTPARDATRRADAIASSPPASRQRGPTQTQISDTSVTPVHSLPGTPVINLSDGTVTNWFRLLPYYRRHAFPKDNEILIFYKDWC